MIALALPGSARIGRRSAAPGVDECLHRPIAADAGRPRTNPGIEPVFAGRLAISGAATSAAIRCCPEEPRTCCCIRPDIVVASAFDKRSTRELLKAKGLHLAELAVPRTLDEARQQIREAGDITGHPDRAAAEIARLDAALARARRAVSERHYRVLPLSRRGWVAGSDSFVGSLLGRNRAAQRGRRSRFRLRRICLAGGDRELAAGLHRGFAGRRSLRGTTARRSCCIRRWSASIRRKSAS